MTRTSALLALLGMIGAHTASAADTYPNRPWRLIVPSGAGGVTDILARVLAERMRASLGQQVVVDNRPGAGGIVGNSPQQFAQIIRADIAKWAEVLKRAGIPPD